MGQQPQSIQGSSQETNERLRQQREELERIRGERQQLEQQMGDLQSTVHDLSAEVGNLRSQALATQRAVASLDEQITLIAVEVDESTGKLVRAEDELEVKRAGLKKRVVDIYKRGPLYTFEALLSAESFGELVARYKYLHLIALRDRALVARVQQLRDQIAHGREQLVNLQNEMVSDREEKQQEEQRLHDLEQQQRLSLTDVQRSAQDAARRLADADRDQQRLASVIATLEADARRAAEAAAAAARARGSAAAPAPVASTLRTSDLGALDWPVNGTIIYRFGRVVNPNNTTTRWNGIGIAAPPGSPVHTVAAGRVVVAEQIGTYGSTVIIQHGGGDYSVYGSLGTIAVRKGQAVSKGMTIGTVGNSDPGMQPHLHFEMRPGGRAVDPLTWLRANR